MKFNYIALKNDGKKIFGTYEAQSTEEVYKYIYNQNYCPVKIYKPIKFFSTGVKLNYKDLVLFSQLFGTLLEAKISVKESISLLSCQIKDKKIKNVITTLSCNLHNGKTVSQSMKMCDGAFSNFFVEMVRISETAGYLDLILLNMAAYYEKKDSIKNKLLNALMYPLILLIVSNVVIFFIFTFVVPTMSTMFKDLGDNIPYTTKLLLYIASHKLKLFLLIMIIIISIVFTSVYLLNYHQRVIHRIMIKIPIVRQIVILDLICNFSNCVSMMLNSNIPVKSALENFSNTITNSFIKEEFDNALYYIKKGCKISTSLDKINLFPPTLIMMIQIGENSSKLNFLLNKASEIYNVELERKLKNYTTILEPLFLLIIGVFIGVVVISLVIPMFNMMDSIRQYS